MWFGSVRIVRRLAMLLAFCYGWLTLVSSFQHNHALTDDRDIQLRISVSSSPTARIPVRTRLAAKLHASTAKHCLACEWQAANTSPALLPTTLSPVPPTPAPPVVTKLARYLPIALISTSSRGPPSA